MAIYNHTQAHRLYKNITEKGMRPRMDAQSNEGTQADGSLLLAEPEVRAKRPSMYKVVLLNDDFTPMDFVVSVLEQIFRKPHTEAMELMLQIHQKGAATVAIYTRDVAETKADEVTTYARINEYPLQCIIEKE